MPRSRVPLLAALALCATLAAPSFAAWPRDPATNVLVSSLSQSGSYSPDVLTDGEGGAFVAWQGLVGSYKTFVQHVTAGGGVAAGWPAGGLQAATGSTQQFPRLASDGAGGVFVAWREDSPDFGNIYLQRVTGSGAIAAGWPAAGVAVCTATGVQDVVRIVAAGALAAAVMLGASVLGPRLSGILIAFPITGSVLPAFTRALYGADATARLIAGFVSGLFAFAVFHFALASALGPLGVAPAYLLAVAAAHGAARVVVRVRRAVWQRRTRPRGTIAR